MKTTFISTYTLNNTQRSTMLSLQKQISDATLEATTGRRADVGLALGYETGKSVGLRAQSDKLQALIDSNNLLLSSMEMSQLNLQSLRKGADVFKDSLLSVPGQNRDASVLVDEAETAMASLYSALNSTDGSRYLFSGINTGVAPLVDFDAALGADGVSPGPKTLVDNAFNAFMAAQAPPVTDAFDLTAAQMEDFLDNEFADLFNDTNWSQTWSTATTTGDATGRVSQISPTEKVTSSATANEEPLRQILMAYTMVSKLQTTQLNKDALELVMKKAEETIVAAYADVSDIESRLGNVQNRVEAATDQMDLQQDMLTKQIAVYEEVDPAEAKVRIDTMTTQLSMSYSLTAQLTKLSILNYV